MLAHILGQTAKRTANRKAEPAPVSPWFFSKIYLMIYLCVCNMYMSVRLCAHMRWSGQDLRGLPPLVSRGYLLDLTMSSSAGLWT